MYKNFVELLEANPVAGKKIVAAICAHEDHVIEAMIDTWEMVLPMLPNGGTVKDLIIDKDQKKE